MYVHHLESVPVDIHSPVVYHSRWQKVKLDIRVTQPLPTPDEAASLQMRCGAQSLPKENPLDPDGEHLPGFCSTVQSDGLFAFLIWGTKHE